MKTMNNIRRTKTNIFKQIITLSLVALFSFNTVAQTTKNDSHIYKYRVTAHKKGETMVSSMSNVAEIIPPVALYIPNSFTPNDDGLNDTFGAIGEGIMDFRMQIFNVWGSLVFETDDANKMWDGTHNGLMCAEGAYAYVVYVKGEKKRIKKSGTVTLIM